MHILLDPQFSRGIDEQLSLQNSPLSQPAHKCITMTWFIEPTNLKKERQIL